MNSHHLILGTTTDYLTGLEIEDNHDERLRQKIIKLLVEEKDYKKQEIKKDLKIDISINNFKASIPVDFTIYIENQIKMIIKYAPGSITSRIKPAIACARLIDESEVPLCVVTNGIEAETIETASGRTIKKGLDSIFKKNELINFCTKTEKKTITSDIRQKAEKILFAFEVNDRCPCDDKICVSKDI